MTLDINELLSPSIQVFILELLKSNWFLSKISRDDVLNIIKKFSKFPLHGKCCIDQKDVLTNCVLSRKHR